MNPQESHPTLEQVQETSEKIKAVCQQADAGIALLDDLIAQLDDQIRSSSLYSYRLNRAKRLLNF